MSFFILFLKGLAMGAADVVPGVSGGTIAFITGIYQTLINSIRAFTPSLLHILSQQGIAAAWQRVNGSFLLILLSGIVVSILSLARVITHVLEFYPILLWSFFFGLILSSSWFLAREIPQWRMSYFGWMMLGLLFGGGVSLLSPVVVEPTPVMLFVAGSIAICAMILPGVSGSFLLLLMGLYPVIIEAVRALDFLVLANVAAGAVIGLLLFSHLLGWLLERYYSLMMALLTGILLGSLVKVWPWKETVTTRINSQGEAVAFLETNILPVLDASLWLYIAAMFSGLLLVIVISRAGRSV